MKKILLCALFVVLCGISSAKAFTSCEDGVVITRNKYTDEKAPKSCDRNSCPENEVQFCMSKEEMSWKEASKWCAAKGGKLAYFSKICPTVQPIANNVKGACPALQGVHKTDQWVWTSFLSNKTEALTIVISTGGLINRSRGYVASALCE